MKPAVLIVIEVLKELEDAEKKHPEWPEDYIHQAAIVCEESGELIRASLNDYYDGPTPNSREEIRKEAIQTAATCIRLLKNL